MSNMIWSFYVHSRMYIKKKTGNWIFVSEVHGYNDFSIHSHKNNQNQCLEKNIYVP